MKRNKLVTTGCCKCNLPFCHPCFAKHHDPSVITKNDEKKVVADSHEKKESLKRSCNNDFDASEL